MQINYYDNKGKNLFVQYSAIALFIATIAAYALSVLNITTYGEITFEKIITTAMNIPTLLFGIIPAIIILIFAVLIFKDYKFKKWMLPIYFGFLCCQKIYSFISTIYIYSTVATHMTYQFDILDIVSIIISFLLFVGSLNNFKFVNIFKIALSINIAKTSYSIIKTLFLTIASIFETNSYPSFGSYPLLKIASFSGLFSLIVGLAFAVSLLVLTIRKKESLVETNTIQE